MTMTVYALMIKANHYLIKSGTLTDRQKAHLTQQLVAARSGEHAVLGFKKGVNAPEYLRALGRSGDTRVMYPLFYIPPYNNGKKLQTVIPMSPKTHILSANSYELEILRLLFLFDPDHPAVSFMVQKTIERLKTTCFAYHDCHQGECFHAALIALRFIAAVSQDTAWQKRLVDYFNRYTGEVSRHSNTVWYFWLCLSELPREIALPELKKRQDEFYARLNKSAAMNNDKDKINNPVLLCILRNCLSRLPEFEYIKNRQPYISDTDGRLHFDMSHNGSA